MSKLRCRCDHVIADQTDNLPYKGQIVSDQDGEEFWGAVSSAVGMPSKDAAADFVISVQVQLTRDAYECESCGRLWVERSPQSNEFVCFLPETGRCEGVLHGRARTQKA